MKKAVLVTGGAGYIGSHAVRELIQRGYQAVVLDNLVAGHLRAVPPSAVFYEGDISDVELVRGIVEKHEIEDVLHFASLIQVAQSVGKPDTHFTNNAGKTMQLFSALVQAGVKRLVMSSTAAVYGMPEEVPVPETAKKAPIEPYGVSQWMIEQTLEPLERAYGLRWMALRYFNACGAALDGSIGEDHKPETHLVPLVLQTALGQRDQIKVFGTDYDTADGTCIREYVHVLDLADAHITALEALANGMESQAFNVGSGGGYSVREIIETAKRVTGVDFPVVEVERRPGDPAHLIADSRAFSERLGWQARYSDLQTIIETAWKWHKNNPDGF